MNYTQAVEYIHSLQKFGIRPGLSRMDAVLCALGNVQDTLRFVHVAGTNGKGSTATAVARSLSCAGYKTGLYTSPYVVDFLERVQVDGSPVQRELFAGCVTRVKEASAVLAEDSLTEFEAITCAALLCYAQAGCDVVVLETGLGGRLDATNVIKNPMLCIITSISLDHTAILGDTLAKIAYEKCGIIKHGVNVICSPCQPAQALEVIKDTVQLRGCTLTVPDEAAACIIKSDITGSEFLYDNSQWRVNMAGEHQVRNMLCVIEALKLLKEYCPLVNDEAVHAGIAATTLPARIQILSQSPLVIIDGGHNPDGVLALTSALVPALKGRSLTVILGMMADKDVCTCVKTLCSLAQRVVCVTVNNPRAIKAGELAALAGQYCDDVRICDDARAAYAAQLSSASQDEVLLVSGSLYLAGEILQGL